MPPSLQWLVDSPTLVSPVLVALVTIAIAAYVFNRDTSAQLRSMLAAPSGPETSLNLARAIARLHGSELAQCIDFDLRPVRLRLHEGQVTDCASKLRKLARFGASNANLEHNMLAMLNQIVALTELLAQTDALRKTPYSSTNPRHERALEELWSMLRPGQARQGGRISKDWADIGFQGTDPATDFRGMGYFSLLNLLALAQEHPAFCARHIATYLQPGGELTYWPFAITSINVSGWLLEMLGAGELDSELLKRGMSMHTLNFIHYALFVRFVQAWERARPKSVMEFGRIQKLALADVRCVGIGAVLIDAEV
jgi:hypothetical protein